MKPSLKIVQSFDHAATSYDQAANVQVHVAEYLVSWASTKIESPQSILDIGSGTGFVAQAVNKIWPQSEVTALDNAPAMLLEAQRKMPRLKVINGDAASLTLSPHFDVIFSSMMLHWLPHPKQVIERWRRWLKPNGRLFITLLIEGSFQEWRDQCHNHNFVDGLWKMPRLDFANELAIHHENHKLIATYPTAHDFLSTLKFIGAATPHKGHQPMKPGEIRHLLNTAPQPFPTTYNTLFLEIPAPTE